MIRLLLLNLIVYACAVQAQQAKHTFALSDTAFLLDGKPFQIISGEMHYARVPREAWRQRTDRLRSESDQAYRFE